MEMVGRWKGIYLAEAAEGSTEGNSARIPGFWSGPYSMFFPWATASSAISPGSWNVGMIMSEGRFLQEEGHYSRPTAVGKTIF